MVWYGKIWFIAVWYGMVGCAVVQYGMVWQGMLWTGRTHRKPHLRPLLVLNSVQDYSIAAFAEELWYQER